MPSLEQIIRPFVVEPTTPPVPYVTTENEPAPDLVRLNIGIGRTSVSNFDPVVPAPTPPVTPLSTKPQITMQTLSSSYSISVQYYHDEDVKERGSAR